MKEGLRLGLMVEMPGAVKPTMKPHLEGLVKHPLYATWAMCYHMETASRMLLAPYLDAHEEAVGGGVLIKHMRPARVGSPLHIVCRLVRVRGVKVYTKVEVYSRNKKLGEGSVVQFVMSRSRFAKLLRDSR